MFALRASLVVYLHDESVCAASCGTTTCGLKRSWKTSFASFQLNFR